MKNAIYEAPHNVIFSILLIQLYLVHIAFCSWTPLMYILPLQWKTKVHIHIKHVKLSLYIFLCFRGRGQQCIGNRLVAFKHWRKCKLNFCYAGKCWYNTFNCWLVLLRNWISSACFLSSANLCSLERRSIWSARARNSTTCFSRSAFSERSLATASSRSALPCSACRYCQGHYRGVH